MDRDKGTKHILKQLEEKLTEEDVIPPFCRQLRFFFNDMNLEPLQNEVEV